MATLGVGALASTMWMYAQMEPFCYYVPGALRKFYKKQEKSKISFDDIVGCDNIKKDIKENINMFLQETSNDFRISSKGYFFVGPPGTGKTMMAKAISNYCNIPFIEIFPEHLPDTQYEKLLNTLSEKYKKCIVYVDEFDKLMTSAGHIPIMLRLTGGYKNSNNSILYIIACNKTPSNELIRSGRIDKVVRFDIPNKIDRVKLSEKYQTIWTPQMSPDLCQILPNYVSEITQGFTHADIEALYRNLSLSKNCIDLNQYKLKINKLVQNINNNLGSRLTQMSKENIKRISIHETAHALMTYAVNYSHKAKHVQICTENNKSHVHLGLTFFNQNEDNQSATDILKLICIYFASCVFEEYYFGDFSLSCKDDIEKIDSLFDLLRKLYMFNSTLKSNIQLISDRDQNFDILSKYRIVILKFIENNKDIIDNISETLIKHANIDQETLYNMINYNLHNYIDIAWSWDGLVDIKLVDQ